MFQISPDQTQWFHLYRVQKISPVIFVILCCEEINEPGNSYRILDLRTVTGPRETAGGSWCVRSGDHRKMVNRAECTKFLELRAKYFIAAATMRGVDEIEMVEASHDELALATSLDESLRQNVAAVTPTLYSRLARNMINNLASYQTGIEFEELTDWRTRVVEDVSEHTHVPESAPAAEPLTTKTQRVPL